MKISLCVLLAIHIGVLGVVATEIATKTNMQSLLATRGQTNVSAWGEAGVSAVLEDIRSITESDNHALRLKALTTLANMGDASAVKELARDFEQATPGQRFRIQRELERHSTQASLIPNLIAELEREEESSLQFVNNEFFVEPVSVVASRIIRSIILRSIQFPESTKAWAMRIDVSNAQTLRAEIRRWCRQNRAELLAHEFGKALPPAEGRE